jgi:hypothetical protein
MYTGIGSCYPKKKKPFEHFARTLVKRGTIWRDTSVAPRTRSDITDNNSGPEFRLMLRASKSKCRLFLFPKSFVTRQLESITINVTQKIVFFFCCVRGVELTESKTFRCSRRLFRMLPRRHIIVFRDARWVLKRTPRCRIKIYQWGLDFKLYASFYYIFEK